MSPNDTLRELTDKSYQYGFVTDIDADTLPPGLSEDVIRHISKKKEEPEWLLEFRLKAYQHFCKLLEEKAEPSWAKVHYPHRL